MKILANKSFALKGYFSTPTLGNVGIGKVFSCDREDSGICQYTSKFF